MKITSITAQVRDPDRVNVSIDGAYKLSLTISQVVDLKVKVGMELSEDQLKELISESEYGKLYTRTLEYSLMRPRSQRELRDYLYKKVLARPVKNRRTGEVTLRPGVAQTVADRVAADIIAKGYVNDESFARYWVENRNQRKGSSMRKLRNELSMKGVSSGIIDAVLQVSDRTDASELQKVIAKKRSRYDDQKLMAYLARQGFRYDDIREALDQYDD
jgi:regulatory protein